MDTNAPANPKLELIRKLLAQSADDSGATAEERESFAQRAAELMVRYGIEQAMIDAHRPPADDPVEHRTINLQRPYPHERGLLLAKVGRWLNVAVYWSNRSATLVGRRSDIERTETLYTALLLHAARPLAAPVNTSWCWDAAEARTATRRHRQSWLLGFADTIGRRMRDAHRAAEQDGEPGTAIVLADRFDAAKRHAEALFGNPGTHKDRRARDRLAYQAGAAHAHSADLGQNRVGGSDRRALSSR